METGNMDIASIKEVLEFLTMHQRSGYGASYFSQAHRRVIVQSLVSAVEQDQDLLSLARTFAGSHAAMPGDRRRPVPVGPSTREGLA